MPKEAPEPLDSVRAAGQAVIALEQEAGIAGAAERARDVFVGFPDTDLPIGSAASLEQGKLERKLEHESVGRKIRAVYFGVSDVDLRKRLIAAYREMDGARHLAAANSVQAARREMYAQVRTAGIRPLEVYVVPLAAAATWAAYTWAGIAFALALIAGLIAGIPASITAQDRRRDTAIRNAKDELRNTEDSAKEAYALGYTFSRSEERTGEPDCPREQ